MVVLRLRHARIVAATAVMLAVAACGGGGGTSSNTPGAPSESTLKVGVCVPNGPGLAGVGEGIKKGADLGAQKVSADGGLTVEIVPIDTGQLNTDLAMENTQKAVEQNGVQVVLCSGSNVVSAIVPYLERRGVASLLISSSATPYANGATLAQQMQALPATEASAMWDFLASGRAAARRVGVLYVDYEFGQSMATAAQKAARKAGQEVVAVESYPQGSTDVRSQLSKVLAANPDAIFLASTSGDDAGLAVRQGRELGYTGIFLSNSGAKTAALSSLPTAQDGVYVSGNDVPASTPGQLSDLVARTTIHALLTYDSVVEAGTAARAVGGSVTGRALIDEIRRDGGGAPTVGKYTFRPDGSTDMTFGVFRVSTSGFEQVHTYTPLAG